jgi:hypothetical protein
MTITAKNGCGAITTKDLSFNIIPFINLEADLSDAQSIINNNPGPTILNGKSVLLSWRFQGSSDCNLTSDADTTWSEKIQTSSIYGNYGEKDSGPLTRSLTYTLRCSTEAGLENSDSVKVTVLDAATPAVDLDAKESKKAFGYATNSDGPLTILPNTSAILSWDSQNVSSCLLSSSGSSQISGITGVSKSGIDTGPLNGETTYRVDCQSSRGPVSDSVVIKTEGIED